MGRSNASMSIQAEGRDEHTALGRGNLEAGPKCIHPDRKHYIRIGWENKGFLGARSTWKVLAGERDPRLRSNFERARALNHFDCLIGGHPIKRLRGVARRPVNSQRVHGRGISQSNGLDE
jgi:hypothetical protein